PTPFTYQLNDLTLAFTNNDFVQVNAQMNQQMVKQALNWLQLQGNEKVLDLFCGFGNFTLPLAKQAAEVLGVEGSKNQVEGAKANALANNLTNAHFVAADLNLPLKEQAWLTKDAVWDWVVLDPPRAGAEAICEQMSQLGAKKVLYVSCNPATLARDSALLLQQGFELKQLGIMDMFPQTAHVECMALFVQH
ncbi:MAG: 23S rRNA (uracil(1939)-C(5))-methyltransferase RlmD, partial [Pseudomonadaceae bacterium]|nr:23S rRNA (uracil(1939)-C(5))-methyltransferase RlmD [Pseudomonadaceae bacterium]